LDFGLVILNAENYVDAFSGMLLVAVFSGEPVKLAGICEPSGVFIGIWPFCLLPADPIPAKFPFEFFEISGLSCFLFLIIVHHLPPLATN
jgi:hypothetical protein